MKYDATRGLYVPENVKPIDRPNWPPRFDVPDDTKHPRSFDQHGNDRGVIAGVGWYTVEMPKHKT